MNTSLNYLRHKNFAIYGLGVTGRSVIRYFDKNGIKNYVLWDDNKKVFKRFLGSKYRRMKSDFLESINFVEHPSVFTLGTNAELKNVLINEDNRTALNIDLVHVDRGGDVTCGQG